jgi:ABC-2 type transport system permease protein
MNRFLWLLKREVWESRAIWMAPAICLAIVLGGAAVAGIWTGHFELGMDDNETRAMASATSAQLEIVASGALGVIATPFFITVLFVQFFYALDALYSERRDRSILFWKSLPVSDLETVLAKLVTALVVLPAVATVAAFIAQVGIAIITSLKLGNSIGLVPYLWHPGVWGQVLLLDLYVPLTAALWYAPLVALYLLVSVAVPRSPFAYFTLGYLGLVLVEKIVFGTKYILVLSASRNLLLPHIFSDRLTSKIVVGDESLHLPQSIASNMIPGEFLASPDLWLGLAFAAACVAGAAWIRRYRDATY